LAKISLMLLDFSCAPLSPPMFSGVLARLGDLSKSMRPYKGVILFTSQSLADELARSFRWRAEVCDALIEEGDAALALAAAVHVTSGRVKLTSAALARAESHPLSILDARSPDEPDPLRTAALVGIALALDVGRTLKRKSAA
jgi:hypothetical protein